MPFTLHKASSNQDFTAILSTEELAYTSPFNAFYEILRGTDAKEWATRQGLWHSHDPSSIWCYVVDDDTGVIAGAMGWNLHEENLDWKQAKLEADWFPKGDLKNLSDKILSNFFTGRADYITTPHLLISYCFTHPSYRHKGVASMMMKWGLEMADCNGLITWVESTQDGKGFYEASGFKLLKPLSLDVDVTGASKGYLAEREKLLLPMKGWILSRAPNGEKAFI